MFSEINYIAFIYFDTCNKLIRLIKLTINIMEADVEVEVELTDDFIFRQDMKQNDGIAPTLFNLILEHIIRILNLI